MRGTLTLLSTLFALALLAFALPRADAALAWASGLVTTLLA